MYGGKRLNNISETEIAKIEELVKVRSIAKIKKDYNVADQILLKLEIDHGVRVDDTKKEWFFLPKFNNKGLLGDDSISDRKQRRRDRKNMNGKEKKDPRFTVPDWSVVDDDDDHDVAMPDGITIDDDEYEPMSQESTSAPNH